MMIMNMLKLPGGCGGFGRKSVCFSALGHAGLFFGLIFLHRVHKSWEYPFLGSIGPFLAAGKANFMNSMQFYVVGVINEFFWKRSLYRGAGLAENL